MGNFTMLTKEQIFDRVKKCGFEPISLNMVNGKRRLNVKCRCGSVFDVSFKHITDGHTKSCGCLQRKNLVGRKFGKLTVVKEIPPKKRSYRGRWWLCRCDCGRSKEVVSYSLTCGGTKTCGCSHFGESSSQWTGYKCISGKFWSLLVESSKRREIPLEIDKKYAYNILKNQNFRCTLSGIPIQIHQQSQENTASLDRIDSSKGYIKGNIQWTHKRINKMKLDDSDDKFIEWCGLVWKYKNSVDNHR